MRAILCLQPAGRGADAGRPGDTAWPPPVLAAWAVRVARWEVEPAGDLYADLGNAAADAWDETVAAAQALLAAARATAPTLEPGGAGLAPGRFAAACAARLARPGTLRAIAPDRAAAVLAPLPVAWLPGLSAPRLRDLRDLRLFTLGDLAALPAPLVVAVFGAAFAPLQALAAGRDPRPVAPGRALADRPAAAAPIAPRQAARPLTPADLDRVATRLAAALAAVGRAATTLLLTVGFHGGPTAEQILRLPVPAADPEALRAAAWPLLIRLLQVRRLRPAWVRLAAPRTCDAATQLCLPMDMSRRRRDIAFTTPAPASPPEQRHVLHASAHA